MSTKVRITTFNVENLFNRYALLDEPWQNRSYEKLVAAVGIASIASRQGDLVSYATTDIQRNNTAQAILDSAPDILVVQEVENLYTLRVFNNVYLSHYFDRIVLIDGNDPRGIDVGVLLRRKFPGEILNVRTHIAESTNNKQVLWGPRAGIGYPATNALFSRDCLEVDIAVGGKTLNLLANHLKAQDGSANADKRRELQAKRVAQLVDIARGAHRLPIVLGDLNADVKDNASLMSLAGHAALHDPFQKSDWTHFYEHDGDVSRLDYILVDKSLSVSNPQILKSGLSKKCQQYTGPRYPTVGLAHTEASDHCPVTIECDL